MSRMSAKNGRYSRILVVFSVLLASTLAVPGAAAGKHPGAGSKSSVVANEFGPNVEPRPSPPPRRITCEWPHEHESSPGGVASYVCENDGGYRQQLSTPDPADEQDFLLRSKPPPAYDPVTEPVTFSCTRWGEAVDAIVPSDYVCRYRHRHGDDGRNHDHKFRMHEMVVLDDLPGAEDPPGTLPAEYVWPPHK